MANKQHIHIIGICGVATSALAIAFHKKGWKVTGSDKGFYPPVSTSLTEAGIEYYAGWHPENIGTPNVIVAGGGGTSLSNPEVMYAKEKGIPLLSFAEALGKYFIKKNSIVVTGTWGKTTISALLSFILLEAGLDPSYFTGGVSLSHDTGALSDSVWSVVEGDEYQAAIWDRKAKFFYYKPTHLLLTSVSWDHADLYPTEAEYFDAFRKIISKIPDYGLIVACADNEGVSKVIGDKKVITYGKKSADFVYHSVSHTREGLSFAIRYDDEEYKISSPMLGRFNTENIIAAFAMAYLIGVPPEKIIAAIKNFKGIKRRLERRLEGDVTVLDCHGPTPEKAASNLESIREVYDKKIIAVYEPNIGGRQHASAHMYDNSFENADIVVIPRLSKLKVDTDNPEQPIDGPELKDIISKTHSHVVYIEDDEKLVSFLKETAKKGDVIAFIGSHGFRGMIEETIKQF